MIERFDARALLDYIPPQHSRSASSLSRGDDGNDFCESDQSKINYERYRDAMRPAKLGVTESDHLELAKAIFSCDPRPAIAAYRRQTLHTHLAAMASDKDKEKDTEQSQQSVIIGYNYETGEGSTITEGTTGNSSTTERTEKGLLNSNSNNGSTGLSEDGLVVDEEDEDWFASATPQYAHWLRFMFKIPRKDEAELNRWAESVWGVRDYCKQCRDEYRALRDERKSMKNRKAHLDLQAEGALRGLSRKEKKRLKTRLGVETDAVHDIRQIKMGLADGSNEIDDSRAEMDSSYDSRSESGEDNDDDDDDRKSSGTAVVEYITEFRTSDERNVGVQELPVGYDDSAAFTVHKHDCGSSTDAQKTVVMPLDVCAKSKGKMTLQEKLKMKLQMQLHSSSNTLQKKKKFTFNYMSSI